MLTSIKIKYENRTKKRKGNIASRKILYNLLIRICSKRACCLHVGNFKNGFLRGIRVEKNIHI